MIFLTAGIDYLAYKKSHFIKVETMFIKNPNLVYLQWVN
jgi:hypothetical protein